MELDSPTYKINGETMQNTFVNNLVSTPATCSPALIVYRPYRSNYVVFDFVSTHPAPETLTMGYQKISSPIVGSNPSESNRTADFEHLFCQKVLGVIIFFPTPTGNLLNLRICFFFFVHMCLHNIYMKLHCVLILRSTILFHRLYRSCSKLLVKEGRGGTEDPHVYCNLSWKVYQQLLKYQTN